MNIIEHFVNGKNFSGDSKRKSKVFNPATGEQTAEVKLASAKDLDFVVEGVSPPPQPRGYLGSN
jgi:malonate-semialdehyde dehydrogenase (acetylating)/methylmalonate-semialdehyde dehydrogenase